MYCKNCGKEISNDAIFCSGCGIRIDNERVKPTVDEQTVDQEYYSTLFVDKDETLIAKCSNEKFFDNSSYVKRVRAGQFGVLVTDKRIYLRGIIMVSKEGKEKTLRRSKIHGGCGMRIDKTDIELKNIISTDLFARKTLKNILLIPYILAVIAFACYCGKTGMEAFMWVFFALIVPLIGKVLESCCLPLNYWLTLMTNEEIIMVMIKGKNRDAVRELQKKIHYAKSLLKSSSEMQQDTQSW